MIQVAHPQHFASQPTDGGLRVRLQQQAEGFLHRGLLGGRSAAPHRLAHQSVININVRPHNAFLLMCKHLTSLCIIQQRVPAPISKAICWLSG